MISGPACPIAGRSTRPVSFTGPDSHKTAELTEAGQPPQAAAVLSPAATAAAWGGPEIQFKPTP